ncbi:transposase [Cohnella panacarvi]|uniref:transposase n=1 Tax=Cohnella panacarvi TaxID=400776 RepID=UPI00047A1A8D|nr:transposase [Cohnella panacarvi]
MEKQTRNRYTEEFKKRTVKYILEQSKTMPEIAGELDISAGVLHGWKQKYRTEIQAEMQTEIQASPDKVRQLEQQLREMELAKQKQEALNADLQEELAILKKALHIFGKERN